LLPKSSTAMEPRALGIQAMIFSENRFP